MEIHLPGFITANYTFRHSRHTAGEDVYSAVHRVRAPFILL
jgi:hypothetical protein